MGQPTVWGIHILRNPHMTPPLEVLPCFRHLGLPDWRTASTSAVAAMDHRTWWVEGCGDLLGYWCSTWQLTIAIFLSIFHCENQWTSTNCGFLCMSQRDSLVSTRVVHSRWTPTLPWKGASQHQVCAETSIPLFQNEWISKLLHPSSCHDRGSKWRAIFFRRWLSVSPRCYEVKFYFEVGL